MFHKNAYLTSRLVCY